MGIIRMGPPEELVLLIKGDMNVSTFIETGTYQGGTTIWAANHFEKVITIEQAQVFFEQVSEKYKHIANVNFLYGDSKDVLKRVLPQIREPAIFWLDAHWCSLGSYGENDECPLIEELDAIMATGVDHIIFIDDARYFLSPPPLPHRIEQWPSLDQIIKTLQRTRTPYYLVVFEDVVIAVPDRIKAGVAGYIQDKNTSLLQRQNLLMSIKNGSVMLKIIKKLRRGWDRIWNKN